MCSEAVAWEEVFTEQQQSGAPWVTEVQRLQNVTYCSSRFPLNSFPLLTCRASSFAETGTDLNWWRFLPNTQALFCYILEFSEVHVSGICLCSGNASAQTKALPAPSHPHCLECTETFQFLISFNMIDAFSCLSCYVQCTCVVFVSVFVFF